MRQSGILAAAAQYALHYNIQKLEFDHYNAKQFALGLAETNLKVQAPQTNMVYFSHPFAKQFAEQLKENGLWVLALGPTMIRAVFHLEISEQQTRDAIHIVQRTIQK